ncbi:MAG: hypothetical protein AAFP84_06560 [Actinomycetota bacterium]
MDTSTTLDAVRTQLTGSGFMPADDEAQNVGYRFVAAQSKKSSNLDDVIINESVENLVPLSGVLGPANQLIITNEFATTKPDLAGIGTDWWFNQWVGVQCTLNETDASAVTANNQVQAFQPMMLTNVMPTSKNVTGIYDNVCVCVEGSVVQFNFKSWGAAGFVCNAAPAQGETIVGGLGNCYPQSQVNNYFGLNFLRYTSSPNTIVIEGTDTMGVPGGGATLRYQKVTFQTHNLSEWHGGGVSVTSSMQPPALNAPTALMMTPGMPPALAALGGDARQNNEGQIARAATDSKISVVPGHAIKPGTTTKGGHSGQTSNEIDGWTMDPNPLGEVVVFFFVFKSHADAVATINGYNAPDPSIWND